MKQTTLTGSVTLLTGGLVCAMAMAVAGAGQQAPTAASQALAAQVAIDADDIGGVVISPNGPEAGVWVIAETSDLPTKYRKIVVTDDRGRYVLPDLPKANYKVWVRGYGLVDSQPVISTPGNALALTAVPAPNGKAAAQIYPADYWYSLLQIPPKDAFPMTVPAFVPNGRGGPPQTAAEGVGAAPAGGRGAGRGNQPTIVRNQAEWVQTVKSCVICHQMGNKATRELSPLLGTFDSSIAAWDRRVRVGQNSNGGINGVMSLGKERGLAMYADWTDRIAAGEVPAAPPRPQGLERNLVITEWDFASTTAFVHDLIASDKRDPTVNANGPLFATEWSHNTIEVLDPTKNVKASMKIPITNEKERQALGARTPITMEAPSPYWGSEVIWEENQGAQSIATDSKGNVWFNARNKVGGNADFCKTGSNNPFAKFDPLDAPGKEIDFYDPKTGKFTLLDTCFQTSHLAFAGDKDDTLYASGGSRIGWVKTRVFLETHDIEKSQGWCPAIVDYNGDGKIGAYTRANEPADPALDRAIQSGGYGVSVNPVDGSVWYASQGAVPGAIVRIQPGTNPPETCLAEIYQPPFNNPKAPGVMGAMPRGIDVDRNGIVWTALATTGQLASFDRSKCAVKNGPTATGQHCPEGWTLYPIPSPKFKGVGNDQLNAGFLYYNWVDRYNTLGLGDNAPLATGTGSDSLFALDPKTKQYVTLRVPYPLGFYTRGIDGRIDDPNTGWKGRGLWGANETRVTWHNEEGKGGISYVAHFQLRPDPLAK